MALSVLFSIPSKIVAVSPPQATDTGNLDQPEDHSRPETHFISVLRPDVKSRFVKGLRRYPP